MFNQLYQYLIENDLIYPGQSGFRKHHSTLTCLLKITDDWYNGLDNGQVVGSVFIDLKKAFDTVDYDLLCKKLEHHGIQQRALCWFQSYLHNRRQYCRVGGGGVILQQGKLKSACLRGHVLDHFSSWSTSMISQKL